MNFDSEDEDAIGDTAKVNMAYIDEKVAAICAIGYFAVATPLVVKPYMDRIVLMLD